MGYYVLTAPSNTSYDTYTANLTLITTHCNNPDPSLHYRRLWYYWGAPTMISGRLWGSSSSITKSICGSTGLLRVFTSTRLVVLGSAQCPPVPDWLYWAAPSVHH